MSTKDFIKKSVLNTFTQYDAPKLALALLTALALGILIYLVYRQFYTGVVYSRSFAVTLVGMCVLTCMVTLAISTNVVISLGMVGALSIVRFRTAIKDSRDTVYIFWSIIVGICCGVGDYLVAAVGSAVVFLIILILGCIKSDNRMLLILRADRGKTAAIKAQVYQLFRGKAVLRVENTTEETVELIYELSQSMLKKAEKKEKDLCSCLYALGNVEYVNIVMQNDEVSG